MNKYNVVWPNVSCIEITDEEEIQSWNSVMYADKRALEMVLFSVAIDNTLYNNSSAKYKQSSDIPILMKVTRHLF